MLTIILTTPAHWLVSEHQVPKAQLSRKGIGEYSPVVNNSNEAGQKINRPVARVLRADKL
jgi:outer membrane protein OmpA-like peptidoglycan-associated protein